MLLLCIKLATRAKETRENKHSQEENNMPENNGANTGAQESSQETKTFTQEQVDSIVEARIKREKEKYSDYEDLKAKAQKYDESQDNRDDVVKLTEKLNGLQAELTARDEADKIRNIREKVAKEQNVPVGLLTADTEEACEEQAKAILAFAKPNGDYPAVKDKGEPGNKGKSSTGAQFAEWAKSMI